MNPFQTLIACVFMVLLSGFLGHYIDHRNDNKGSVDVFLEPIEPKLIRLETANEFLSLTPQDKYCLALNVYHEAKHEPYIGKIAVAQVTHKRVQKGFRGATFCQVVFAPHQFSWTDIPSMRNEQPSGPSWIQAKHVVEMYNRGVRTSLNTSDHYHADYITLPRWAKQMQFEIGRAHV